MDTKGSKTTNTMDRQPVTIESLASEYGHQIGALEAVWQLYTELGVTVINSLLTQLRFKQANSAIVRQLGEYVKANQSLPIERTILDLEDVGFGAFEQMIARCYLNQGAIEYVNFMQAVADTGDQFIIGLLQKSFDEISSVMQAKGYSQPKFGRSPIRYA